MEPDDVEIRVLGCLVEKHRTTPDAYPLSLNALRLACNQSTNRDPIVSYQEDAIRDALQRLSRRGWVRLASGRGSRAIKYRHIADTALRVGEDELAILAVLMLRGPQTPGELRARTERLHAFEDAASLEGTLTRLAERDMALLLERRPGQKEARWQQLVGGASAETLGAAPGASAETLSAAPVASAETLAAAPVASAETPVAAPPVAAPSPAPTDAALAARVADLERELARLRAEFGELRESLGG